MKLKFVVHQIRLVHVGTNRDRVLWVERRVFRVVFTQKAAYILVVLKHLAAALLVRGEKSVKGDNDR